EIAGRAIVLLKNDAPPGDTRGLLPLSAGDGASSIAVLGEFARTPRYQGGGSSQITPTRLDDALTEITAATEANVLFAPGYTVDEGPEADSDAENPVLVAEAVAVAQASDVAVVFVGTAHETEGA